MPGKEHPLRKVFASTFLLLVSASIGMLFWHMELIYTQPTPVPEGYKEVFVNDFVYLDDTLKPELSKPVFYHFFTTTCPCSRFNLTHFNELKKQYSTLVDFYVVIPAEDDISDARRYFEGETQIIRDTNKQFAIRTGVYATPQAVLINTDHRLYFRGNYNKSRYCTDPFSNFAQMALDSIRLSAPAPDFGILAQVAYGCGLPTINQEL